MNIIDILKNRINGKKPIIFNKVEKKNILEPCQFSFYDSYGNYTHKPFGMRWCVKKGDKK